MPFTDAFSIANPFSVNPQYSNTPQAAQAKAAQVKAHTPEASSIPKPATDENPVGAEALSAARTSPLMEAIAGYHDVVYLSVFLVKIINFISISGHRIA